SSAEPAPASCGCHCPVRLSSCGRAGCAPAHLIDALGGRDKGFSELPQLRQIGRCGVDWFGTGLDGTMHARAPFRPIRRVRRCPMRTPHARSSPVRLALAGLAAAGVLALTAAPPAGASSFTVTTSADSGAGSLRQALASAAANPGADTITVAPGVGTITL